MVRRCFWFQKMLSTVHLQAHEAEVRISEKSTLHENEYLLDNAVIPRLKWLASFFHSLHIVWEATISFKFLHVRKDGAS
jgi:hypothetical protein